MRRTRLAAAVMVLACGFAPALAAADLQPLDEAAYRKLIATSKGKVVLVNFWATFCAPCRKEMPKLVELDAKLKARGFQLITISADEPEQAQAAKAFLERIKVPAPLYIRQAADSDKFNHAIEARWDGALPASILYDRAGRKVKTFLGEIDIVKLNQAITPLL